MYSYALCEDLLYRRIIMSEKISVCMATYNGEKYIKEQVDSILKQLGPEDEIIVSDDGSKDATIETLRSYCDVRIKIYHHTSCGANSFEKASSNFENALTKATGDIIFLSDQDDIWTDDKVKVMVDGLKNNLMVQCQLAPFSADSETDTKLIIQNQKGFLANLCVLPFVGCCMAFRKSLLESILPFPKGIIAHDAWIGMVGFVSGRYMFINDKCQLYRLHGANVSGVSSSTNSLWCKLCYRFRIAWAILRRYNSITNGNNCLIH